MPDGKNFFFANILNGMPTTDGGRKAEADRPVLVSREERIALLRTGFSGKDIESLYLKLNGIVIIDVNWQE
jgi:hypothetical protein